MESGRTQESSSVRSQTRFSIPTRILRSALRPAARRGAEVIAARGAKAAAKPPAAKRRRIGVKVEPGSGTIFRTRVGHHFCFRAPFLESGRVTAYRPADVVRHEVCAGPVQSGGAAGPGAARRRGTRRVGPGLPAPAGASPRLRSERRSCATRRRRTAGPSGRGGRAERAQARPHVARGGSAALPLAIRARRPHGRDFKRNGKHLRGRWRGIAASGRPT
jgi:hypothetical protein